MLSIDELAEFLGVPRKTIIQWRYMRIGPRGYKFGRHVRYRMSDVEKWMETQRDPERRKW